MTFIADAAIKSFRAISRARTWIVTIAGTYAISILVGIIMVHSGSSFAINYRDQLVGDAGKQDPAAIASAQGSNLKAALLDFAGNLVVGSVPKTIMGMGIVFPYPFVAYQGWIGGIVSVRGDHTSRLNDARSAVYYLLALFLQITAYSLAIGGGVNVGISMFRPAPEYQGEKWARIFPKEALLDMARIYPAAIILFFIGSLWEFLSPWNI